MSLLPRTLNLLPLALAASTLTASVATPPRPNIVVILADDLGYGSVGCYGAPPELLKTPNIDRLAREGIRFTNAYTPSSVCTPTRYGLLTGRYCWRSSLKSGLVDPMDPLLIETTRPTLASLLHGAGYVTGLIGKWHLGIGEKVRDVTDLSSPLSPGPRQVGFDYYFGIPQNHGEPWGVYAENETVWGLRSTNHVKYPRPSYYGAEFLGFDAPQRDDWTAQTALTDRAVDWIKQQTPDKPFFLYFASAAIHEPITPTKAVQGTSGAGVYGDWIHDMDITVGRIMEALEAAGFGKNTLVIFTSDNGGVTAEGSFRPNFKVSPPYTTLHSALVDAQKNGLKPNSALRGQKGGIYEGGFRVPLVARWPEQIPADAESGQMISLVDFMATTADLLKVPVLDSRLTFADSVSFLPALLGKPTAKPIRESLVLHSNNGTFAIIKGTWKWIEGIPAKRPGKAATPPAGEELYDLAKDPVEKMNLLQAHPDVAKELQAALNQVRNG